MGEDDFGQEHQMGKVFAQAVWKSLGRSFVLRSVFARHTVTKTAKEVREGSGKLFFWGLSRVAEDALLESCQRTLTEPEKHRNAEEN